MLIYYLHLSTASYIQCSSNSKYFCFLLYIWKIRDLMFWCWHKFYLIYLYFKTIIHMFMFQFCGKWEMTKLKQNPLNIYNICLWPRSWTGFVQYLFCATESSAFPYLHVLKKKLFLKRNQFIPDMAGKQLEVVNTLQQWSTSAHLTSNIKDNKF